MKISVVLAEGVKQIMFTPETEHEKKALKHIAPNDEYSVASVMGTFDSEPQHYSYNASMCQGGNLRRFAEKDSLMFVLKPVDNSHCNKEG